MFAISGNCIFKHFSYYNFFSNLISVCESWSNSRFSCESNLISLTVVCVSHMSAHRDYVYIMMKNQCHCCSESSQWACQTHTHTQTHRHTQNTRQALELIHHGRERENHKIQSVSFKCVTVSWRESQLIHHSVNKRQSVLKSQRISLESA